MKSLAAAFALFAAFLTPPGAVRANDLQIAQQNMMQCMTDCIKTEGESEYDSCKLRCADVPMGGEGSQSHDCMGDFKQCKKACKNDKDCKQACKDALMGCG